MKSIYKKPVTVAEREEADRCARGKVSVIDDDHQINAVLALSLKFNGYACDIFSSARDFLESLNLTTPRYPGPRCVLCDVNMPEMDGLALQDWLSERKDIPLLLMSGSSKSEQIIRGFRGGAVHFLLKPIEDAVLFPAIAEALANSLVAEQRQLQSTQIAERRQALTAREWDVIRLVARGYRNQEISQELNIALRTVKHHKHQAMEKLGVERVVDLIGLVD